MMSETVIDKPVDDTDASYEVCIVCGGHATMAGKTLCVRHWAEAEGDYE